MVEDENCRLYELVRALQTITKVQYQHVKGHSGQPWNEAADVIANASVKNTTPTLAVQHPLTQMAKKEDSTITQAWKWAAQILAGTTTIPGTPPLGREGFRMSPVLQSKKTEKVQQTCGNKMSLKMLQLNALTLRNEDRNSSLGEEHRSARIAYLDFLIAKEEVSVSFTPNHVCLVSGTDQGRYGCEMRTD